MQATSGVLVLVAVRRIVFFLPFIGRFELIDSTGTRAIAPDRRDNPTRLVGRLYLYLYTHVRRLFVHKQT